MKTQKRRNAKAQKREFVDLTKATSVTINEIRDKIEIESLSMSIKLLQKIRRDLLAKQRRKK